MKIMVILLILVAVLTVVVGGYFVDYALVPNNGAEEREIVRTDLLTDSDPETIEAKVDRLWAEEEDLRDEWTDEMGLDVHEVSIESHDGLRLYGHAFEQAEPTNKWMIAVHGYQSDEDETLMIGRHFYEAGYNVLTISLRAHGKSEGNYIGMGFLDKEDLISWTNALVAKHPDSAIFYHGTSMGGATVLMASGMELPPNVKAVVSDCAYSSIWAIFSSEMKKRFNLPSFPILNMAHIMGMVKAGYNIRKGNVLDYVKNSTLPILFIHTKKDDFVPIEMVGELYDAKEKGDKELYILEEGGHAQAKFVEPVAYYERISTFLETYL